MNSSDLLRLWTLDDAPVPFEVVTEASRYDFRLGEDQRLWVRRVPGAGGGTLPGLNAVSINDLPGDDEFELLVRIVHLRLGQSMYLDTLSRLGEARPRSSTWVRQITWPDGHVDAVDERDGLDGRPRRVVPDR